MAFSSLFDTKAALYLFSVAFASHLHLVFSLVCALRSFSISLETSAWDKPGVSEAWPWAAEAAVAIYALSSFLPSFLFSRLIFIDDDIATT